MAELCTEKELVFVVFLIYCLAEHWGKIPKEVYEILESTHILSDYIIKNYDVLHTMGKEALVEDITEFAREEGVVL